ncbi:HNH endonuclease [Amphritea spongicola]|nr:HNH endonuclease [Aliamphritea spongicola]
MKMRGGNKAILDHAKLNKEIHLFEYTRKAYVRYIGTADCLGYHEESRPDKTGDSRNVYIFHLAINSDHDGIEAEPNFEIPASKNLKKKTTKQLRDFCLLNPPKQSNREKKLQFTYVRSEAIKLYVNARSRGICEGCEEPAPFKTNKGPFLECHHIHRLSDGGPDHPLNVAALCPNCHRRAHHSIDAVEFNKLLINKVTQLEA